MKTIVGARGCRICFRIYGSDIRAIFKTGYFSKDLKYLPLFIASCQFNNLNSNLALG